MTYTPNTNTDRDASRPIDPHHHDAIAALYVDRVAVTDEQNHTHQWRDVDPTATETFLRDRAALVLPSMWETDPDRATDVLRRIMSTGADVVDVLAELANDAGTMVDVRSIIDPIVPDREVGQIPNVDGTSTVTHGRRTLKGRPVVVGADDTGLYGSDTSDHLLAAANAFLASYDALDGSTALLGGEHLAFPEVVHAGVDMPLPGVTSRHALVNDALAAVRYRDVYELLRDEHRARWNTETLSFDVDRGAPRATHHRRLVRETSRLTLRASRPRRDERLGPVSVVPVLVVDRSTGRRVIEHRTTVDVDRRTFVVDVDGSTVSHVDVLTIDARSTSPGTIDRGRDTFVHGHGRWVPRSSTVRADRDATRRRPRAIAERVPTIDLASRVRVLAAGLAAGERVAVTDGTVTVTVSRPVSVTGPFTVTCRGRGTVAQSRTRRPTTVAATVDRYLSTD